MSLFAKILRTPAVTEAVGHDPEAQVAVVARQIGERARKLFGRSLHIREVDAGSCNGCELEISALSNPYYDMERLLASIFVASRRATPTACLRGDRPCNTQYGRTAQTHLRRDA